MGPSRPTRTCSYHGRPHVFIRHHHGRAGHLLFRHLQAQDLVFRCAALLPLVQSRGPGSSAPAPPHARMSGSLSLRRGLSLMRTPGGGHEHPHGAPSSSTPHSGHRPPGASRGSMRVPGPGLGGGVGGHWRRRRRNRARPRHHRCQGGCRALGGVSRGVCGPGWGLCSALSLHASLCHVVNMRDEHDNMCIIVSVARP